MAILEKITKHKHLLFDLIIAILVVLIIILLDLFITSFSSNPAEEKNVQDKQAADSQINNRLVRIEPGQRAFLPILNFHHISQASVKADSITRSFFIEPEKFEAIVKSLIAEGYRSVFVSEAVDYLNKREMPTDKIMAITFDDGNEDFYTNAWPILQKYKVKSSVYIMTGVGGSKYLSKDQVVGLDKSGLVEIGSHTIFHPYLTKVSVDRQFKELKDSKEFLERLLNKPVAILCYPFGLYNKTIEAMAQEIGYKAALTFDKDAWQNPDNLYELKRISIYPSLDIIKFLHKIKNP